MATILDDLAQLVVQRLDAVRRIDHSPQHRWKCEKWGEPVPRVLEYAHGVRVHLPKLGSCKIAQRDLRGILVDGLIDGLECC